MNYKKNYEITYINIGLQVQLHVYCRMCRIFSIVCPSIQYKKEDACIYYFFRAGACLVTSVMDNGLVVFKQYPLFPFYRILGFSRYADSKRLNAPVHCEIHQLL